MVLNLGNVAKIPVYKEFCQLFWQWFYAKILHILKHQSSVLTKESILDDLSMHTETPD